MNFIRYTLFAVTFLTSLVLMCIPGTQAFGVGMFMAGMKAAISGALIGGVIGGLISAAQGNGFFSGVVNGMVNGLIDGFTAGALLYCVTSAIGAMVNAANKAQGVDETLLQQRAIAARDAEVAKIRATGDPKYIRDANVVVGGYDKVTQQVAVGVQGDAVRSLGQKCAEDVLVAKLGGPENLKNIVMTQGIRPRNLQAIAVCRINCQVKYLPNNFIPGTIFE